MTRIEDIRLGLVDKGYEPLPLNGKSPVLDKWQKRNGTSPGDIEIWSKLYPYAGNTGILTKFTPVLDIDILDPEAAAAVEALARERFEELGYLLPRSAMAKTRHSVPHRRAVRQDQVELIAPDGTTDRSSNCCATASRSSCTASIPTPTSPMTGSTARLANSRVDLPYISVEEAQALVDDAVDLAVPRFRLSAAEKPKAAKHGGQGERGRGRLGRSRDLADHDSLAAFAMALMRSAA